MKTPIFPLLLLSVLLFSCTSNDDEPIADLDCQTDNNKVTMTKFVKSESKSNNVKLAYSYNELNLLSHRRRTAAPNVFETEYVYNCSNNIIEIITEETANPQRDGSTKYYQYDAENRLTAYKISLQGEFDYQLTYTDNFVNAKGTIWNDPNASLNLALNEDGLVERIIRTSAVTLYDDIMYTHFDYDANGNMIKIQDYDQAGALVNSFSITYDNNINPYDEQLKSIYIVKFIDLFFQSGHWASDLIGAEGFIFPFAKNNILLVTDNTCTDCYEEVTKRTISYDEEAFPENIVHSKWGGAAVENVIEYY